MSKKIDGSEFACLTINACLKEENSQLKQQLAEKDSEIERLKQDYDEIWEDTYFSVKEYFELNNNCNECRRYYAEEFNKQSVEKDKDKISFAVDQLEKVKEWFIRNATNDFNNNAVLLDHSCTGVLMLLDGKIKDLKG